MIMPNAIHDKQVDTAPGDPHADHASPAEGLISYAVGLGIATVLTVVAFALAQTHMVWGPSIPVALAVLAVGQMAIHLIFFLHLTSGPDNVNNIMALAFGIVIVFLVVIGSIWIMYHLDYRMMPMAHALRDQP